MGRGALAICSMDGAGVVALAVAADACRHWKQTYCVAGVVVRRTCFAARWRCSLGAMVGGDVYVSSVVLRQLIGVLAAREEQVNASQLVVLLLVCALHWLAGSEVARKMGQSRSGTPAFASSRRNLPCNSSHQGAPPRR